MAKEVPSAKHYAGFIILFDYTQVDNEDIPVMAICNPKNRTSYLIPLPNAYLYANSQTGEPTAYLVESVKRICEALNLHGDRTMLYKMAGAVVDNLPDLIEMPPKPSMTKKQVEKRLEDSGAVMRVNGETLLDAR